MIHRSIPLAQLRNVALIGWCAESVVTWRIASTATRATGEGGDEEQGFPVCSDAAARTALRRRVHPVTSPRVSRLARTRRQRHVHGIVAQVR